MDATNHRANYFITTDKAMLDLVTIHDYLCNTSYWAQGRPFEAVVKSVEHSLCFGVFQGREQVAFARVVTDHTTFAWLCDVFVLPPHQGRGLGKLLIESVVAHPDLTNLRLFILATSDAHELYRRYGDFQEPEHPAKLMVRIREG